MDLFDVAFLDFWKALNENKVRYILVGGFATNFHGYQRYTGDVDLYIDDTPENRKDCVLLMPLMVWEISKFSKLPLLFLDGSTFL